MAYRPNSFLKANKQPQQFAQEIAATAGANIRKFPKQNAGGPRPSNGIFPGRTPRPPHIPTTHTKVVNRTSHAAKLLGT